MIAGSLIFSITPPLLSSDIKIQTTVRLNKDRYPIIRKKTNFFHVIPFYRQNSIFRYGTNYFNKKRPDIQRNRRKNGYGRYSDPEQQNK